MNPIVVVGCQGQDGTILVEKLKKEDKAVIGIDVNHVCFHNYTWGSVVDITNFDHVCNLIEKTKPLEVYYFAAYHHSSQEQIDDIRNSVENSYKINVTGYQYFLEAIRRYSLDTKILYTASSLLFSGSGVVVQTENTPFSPTEIYGITKLNGLLLSKLYRNDHGVFASCGIMYNHESEYRADKFLSMKLIQGGIDIKRGKKDKLVLAALDAQTDWGYAPDYVDAMRIVLSLDTADEFIISSNKLHSVLDFVKAVFDSLELSWEDYVVEDKSITIRNKPPMQGDNSKLVSTTGWKPSVSFEEMIDLIIKERLKKL